MKLPITCLARLLFSALAVCAGATDARGDVAFDWVHVGDAGNPSDPQSFRGAVSYEYNIGKYEVTNAQYVQFLNAKAAADPVGLYNPAMGTDARGGIIRSGSQ